MWTGVQACAFFFSSRRRHTRSDRDWSSDVCFFFFQAEDGIRDLIVNGVQTCALPILAPRALAGSKPPGGLRYLRARVAPVPGGHRPGGAPRLPRAAAAPVERRLQPDHRGGRDRKSVV